MNSTVTENQTFSVDSTCLGSETFLIQLSVIALDFTVLLPIQISVLWLGLTKFRIKGCLPPSEIFTMNLAALEFFVIILYAASMVAYVFHYQHTVLLVMFFSGGYLVGRPIMNSWICVERYIAVAHPLIYCNPAYVKHRYIAAALVWLAVVAYGGLAVFTYPYLIVEVYIVALSNSILMIAACNLGVLKILLKPSPGEAQKERMNRQKKRALIIITVILVCISGPYILDVLLLLEKKYLSNYIFCLLVSTNFWLMRPGSVIQSIVFLSKRKKLPCTRKGNS